MTQEVFYRKKGRRYEPVSYYCHELMESMPIGVHLVCVIPGEQSFVHRINPDHAAILGALRLHRNALLDSLRGYAMATSQRPLTKKELAGLEAYKAITGNDSLLLSRPSAMGVIEALEKALIEVTHPDDAPSCASC